MKKEAREVELRFKIKKGEDSFENIINFYIDLLEVFKNRHRREILKICYGNPKTISELKRILNSSNMVTWNNVKKLEEYGFVILNKKVREKHHPVYVESIILPHWFKGVFFDFMNEIDEKLKKEKLKKK